MSPEERQLLQSTYELSQENHEILQGLRRSQRWQTAGSVFKWLLIIGSTLGLYYYFQPFLDSLKPMLENLQKAYQNIEGFGNFLPR